MRSVSRQNVTQTVAASTIALVSLLAIVALQMPQLSQLRRTQTPSVDWLKQSVETERLRLNLLKNLPSFGYDNLIANWAFLNFLQYFGDEPARLATDYRLSPAFFEVIVDRDPRFLKAYNFLSPSVGIYGGQPERSIALMGKGLESMTPTMPPGSYVVWRNKAIDELLFLGNAQAARRSFQTAADWAEASGLPEGKTAAEISRQTAQFLATNPDSKAAQVTAWAMVLTTAVDDRTRRTAADRIQSLGGTVSQTPDGTFRVQLPKQD